MFFKKNQNTEAAVSPQVPQEEVNKIRVMPPKFVVEEKKNGHGFLILIILLIVLATLAVGAAFLVLQNKQREAGQQNIDISANTNANTAVEETNVNSENTNVNAIVNAEPTPTPSPDTNANTAVETNINVENTPPPSEFTIDTSDIDADKLTGEEEKIFSTNANNADTDSDGYSDYNEILSGYDPRQTGKTLLESGLVQEYVLEGNAKTIYPSKWFVKTAGQLVIFDTKRGDSMSIAFLQNTDKLEPQDWILKNDTGVQQSQIVQANLINKANAYRTNDNLKYFVFSSDFSRVYIFTYRPSIISSIPFLSTFEMIVQSIRL